MNIIEWYNDLSVWILETQYGNLHRGIQLGYTGERLGISAYACIDRNGTEK